ncbi:MAG: hypothetical protein QF795_03445 [Candidatus Marinimicrobia bacterium]|nr:hypothetical protein [Candidatus Neomarinimicrobiota bacterium]
MKKITLLIGITVCVIMLISCGDGVIGSESNSTINHIEWSLDSNGYVVTNSGLKATGTITNIGDTTILAPWYVEAEFYEDSTFSFILGGDQQYHDVNLYVNVGRPWTLEFSSSDIDAWNYTDFAIKNFRAFIKK